MKKVSSFGSTLLLIGIAAGVLNCSGGSSSDSVVTIGVSLPLTGDAAVWGTSQKDGYDLALAQINEAGGIDGRRVNLIYEDDEGLPRQGLAALRKLIDVDHIQILTGVANSSVALAYLPIIDENQILFVSSGASSPKLTGSSPYFFRTWPSDISEALAMARYAREELGVDTISILYINNDYGVGLSEPFAASFQDLGGQIVGQESFEQNATDLRTQLTKIRSQNPEAIYLAGNPREMARAIRQARELGIEQQFLSVSTLNDPEVFSIAQASELEGTVITDASFDPHSDTPAARAFLSDFRAMFDKDPGILANTAYDALMIIAHSIEQVGSDPAALREYLASMPSYSGVAGKISFTEGGDVNRPIRIAVVEGGAFRTLEQDFEWH